MATAEMIENLVTISVMITAVALLIQSTHSRLLACISQLRAIQHERADLLGRQVPDDRTAQHVRSVQLDGLRSQASHMLTSARCKRFTLLSFYTSVILLLLCMACACIATLSERFQFGAVSLFGSGVFAFAVGIFASAIDVSRVMQTVTIEHGRIGIAAMDDLAAGVFA